MLKSIFHSLKHKILNKLTRDLLKVPVADGIVKKSSDGSLMVGDTTLTEDDIYKLGLRFEDYLRDDLYKILNSTVIYNARQMMFEKCRTTEDLIAAKSVLYALSLQGEIINTFIKEKRKIAGQKAMRQNEKML